MTEYTFDQLVEMSQIRQLLESHHRLSGMAYALFDTDENSLAAVGWQDICARFHHGNPVASVRCPESTAFIKSHLHDLTGELLEYSCRNGMIDIAMPIIIDGKHLATFITGQFFCDDALPDREYFVAQAEERGIAQEEYLAALDLVPLFSRDHIRNNVLFLHNMVQVLAEMGFNNLRLVREMKERKQAERHLVMLSHALNNSRDAVYLVDDHLRFVYVNDVACRAVGYSREELLTMGIIDIDPDLPAEHLSRIMQTTRAIGPNNIETRHRTKDGHIFPVEVTGTFFEFEGHCYNLALARDITERKQVEEEIRHLQNYLVNIIDSMPFLLVGIDRNETVTQWNRAAEKFTGIPTTEAIGKSLTELIPDFSPWVAALLGEVGNNRSASMKKFLIETQGERRFYDLMLYPLVSSGVEGTVIRIEDVTEQARIQEVMIQTEKMMSLGGLAAGMAHEINNPLGIITQAVSNIERRMSATLPANSRTAEEVGISMEGLGLYFEKRRIKELIASINTAASRATRIISNVLHFSCRSDSNMQCSSLETVLNRALELANSDYDLKKRFDFRDIRIIRDYMPDMPDVPMMMVEIEQVALNLLKNAAQAMFANPPEQKPRIVLRIRREERYAVIEVEDNGSGMAEDVRRRVFEPFFTTREPGHGTGLGLSVSYMIITRNHKGLMEVASAPGNGACFTVRLPLNRM